MHVVNEPQDPECGCNEIQKIKTRREKREREREIDGLQSDRQTERRKLGRERGIKRQRWIQHCTLFSQAEPPVFLNSELNYKPRTLNPLTP